jgi:uncharacterized iron-regulated membrane protein
MYHKTRWLHRWIGAISALFLVIIAGTGFLLATKSSFGWVRPPESKGTKVDALAQVISLEQAAEAAFAVGLKNLAHASHIDRIDYRPKSNMFKVLSKEGYHEVQVDGATGRVLGVNYRTDQLAEDIHDLSFFKEWMKTWVLPVVALVLLALAVTGIGLFATPILRRAKFKRKLR